MELRSIYASALDEEGKRVQSYAQMNGYDSSPEVLDAIRQWLKKQGLRMVEPGENIPVNTDYMMANGGGWLLVREKYGRAGSHGGCVIFARVDEKPQAAASVAQTGAEDEHARMCRFFFGRPPTDPKKLPAPPKVVGTTWDELSEW